MKVICAGLSKTGTKSVAAALRILGFTVHDYLEHSYYHMDEYIQAMNGVLPDFTTMYSNIDVVIATPACFFWKEMKESFPDAKVILMERDNAELWANSLLKTVAVGKRATNQGWSGLGSLITPTGRKRKTFVDLHRNIYKILPDLPNRDDVSSVYLKHNARVKATILRDDLLVFNVKQGWKPLCEFLGVDVPDVQFPRLNINTEGVSDLFSHSAVGNRVFRELVFILTMLFTFLAIVIFMIVN